MMNLYYNTKKNKFTKTTIANKTKKNVKINGKIKKKNGWKIVEIYGKPFERGFAHGYLLASDLLRVQKVLPFIVKEQLNTDFNSYLKISNEIILPIVENKYPEFFEEIKGISYGAKKAGVIISVEYLISWNAYLSLYSYYNDGKNKNDISKKTPETRQMRCSAFIACGNATETGEIVMAHNTHSDFASGQILNIILHVHPFTGNSFSMQTTPGYICSSSDWFITEKGIIGCETTISDINYKPLFGSPYFCRIRQLMQYSNTLNDCVKILSDDNAGDYACSWLLGDVKNGEIMLFELGLNVFNIEKKNDGYFFGMNVPVDPILRNIETNNNDYDDTSTSVGSRNKRFEYLLGNKYKGKINLENAKKIISDHYDCFLNKNKRNHRSICRHDELDDEPSKINLNGSIDGKIVNTEMALNGVFLGKFGSSCGRVFNLNKFIKNKTNFKKWETVLENIDNNEWTLL